MKWWGMSSHLLIAMRFSALGERGEQADHWNPSVVRSYFLPVAVGIEEVESEAARPSRGRIG